MKRTDLEGVIKGKGNFVDDLPFSGYHAAFVRSTYPHARIRVDPSEAVKRGALVLTGEDVRIMSSSVTENEGSATVLPLAFKKVRFQGEPIALVLAEDPYKAVDLAELVNVDYEPLEPVSNIEEALSGKSLVFEEKGSNVVYNRLYEYGRMPREDRSIELELYWSRSSGNPIETYGVIVYPQGDSLKVISNVQAPYFQGQLISKVLGKVNMVPVRHGGSFGAKFSVADYIIALGLASKKFNVPIKWVETRTEHLMASKSSGPERKFKVTAYFKSDGTVTGLDFKVWEDVGATLFNGQAYKPEGILAGPYKVRNIRYDASLVATNKNPAGAFRGAGTPPHTWALERVMDALADDLKADRSEVREKNLVDSFPYEAPYAVYDSGDPKGLLKLALSRQDVFELRKKGYGVGIAVSTDPSTPAGQEGVKIVLKKGKVVVKIGYGPEGQGNEHVAKLLVSKFLGVPVEKVDVELAESDEGVTSFGPGGSRMSVFLSGAIKGAAEELVSKLKRELGAEKFENGYFITKEGERVNILELEGEATYVVSLQGKKGRFLAYPFAVDIAVVKVDETGLIRPVKLIVYIDPGTPLDEEVVKEQVIGGSYIGVSLALYERYVYEEGQLLTTSLSDYNMITAVEVPEFEVNIVPTPSPYTPLGSKGIGEIPVGVAAAAVTSAVEDLLKRRVSRIPVDVSI
ncbi:MAG: aldehyde oxidase and xanthine dehydrogenase molybdopterin binding protein [Candidatus Aramenus sulfurataquae]|uniref:Aldehyde oxidase and xanthine dehydrogenase molybdopterin binding protein n=2 Tax=Candidatus Aramenus sulfurataquae TaxID=1326980 RepID=W7KWM5_9CREN|nr:MAG: aldehyde oxidase and xanthine dehydrogenase molybdopterin binding protein [Candidatus Aramenus sulfurataquae]